jgi:NADH dehydrogenase/NADH:ubiquinone oxidoreductase subunit G
MADKKITQLTNITGADLASADEFVVVDSSVDETKAITFDELKNAFDTATGFVRITGDTMTGNLTVPTVIGNVTGTVSSLSNHDTGDLSEGSNLYYTDARANSAIDARVTQAFVNNLNVDAETLDGDTKATLLATAESNALALSIALG